MVDERRSAMRIAFRDGILPPRARVRPGCDVVVVDLSPRGALVEGPYRFRPDTRCELSVCLGQDDTTLRAHIVRSFVARLDRWGPVRYRAALNFERPVAIPASLGEVEGIGFQCPRRDRAVPG